MKNSPKKEIQKAFCYTHYLNPSSELHPEFVRFDYNAGLMDFKYGVHRHMDHELIYVESGYYKAWLNHEKITLNPGSMLLVCPGDLHDDESRMDLKFYSLSFTLRPGRAVEAGIPLLKRHELNAADQVFSDESGVILSIMKEASAEMQSRETGSTSLAHILLHELFWRMVRGIPDEFYSVEFRRCSEIDDFPQSLYRVLADNVNHALDVPGLARKLAVSTTRLNRLCNEYLKKPPARLICEYKILQAKEFLVKTDLSIKEISDMLKFKDQFSFSRTFKRLERVSPLQFRQLALSRFMRE